MVDPFVDCGLARIDHGEAWRAQDDGSPQERRALHGEAHDAPQLHDTQEAPLSQVEV